MNRYTKYCAVMLIAALILASLSSCGLGGLDMVLGGILPDGLGDMLSSNTPSEEEDKGEESSSEVDTSIFETFEEDTDSSDATDGEQGYRERILLVTDFHYCKNYYGVSMDDRMNRMVKHINAEHEKDPLSMIIFMGDYSLDHWGYDKTPPVTYINTGVSHTQLFMEKYKSKLPDVPMFWLAGNHEQFGEENWKKITGNSRQGYEVIEDYLIIMWDSYGADLDPKTHSDGTYTPMDTEWVGGLMAEYPDKKVILISHSFSTTKELGNSEAIVSDDRVVALFAGHNHSSHLQNLGSDFGYKTLAFAGNYSYYGSEGDPGDHPWGFRDLVLEHDKVRSAYIITENSIIVNGKVKKIQAKEQNVLARRIYWKEEE